MSHEPTNFVDRCLAGLAFADEIDDYVHRWHSGEGDPSESLAEFLGFTEDEYALWVEKPAALDFIFYARKTGHRLSDVRVVEQAHRIAARSLSSEDAEELTRWLKETGRITE